MVFFWVQIISLGSHSIDADFEQAVLLMEIMPTLLAKRSFDPLNTLLQLEPGYRDSPDPHEDMAIVFVKVLAPFHDLCPTRHHRCLVTRVPSFEWEPMYISPGASFKASVPRSADCSVKATCETCLNA